jgi:hypothetical protein
LTPIEMLTWDRYLLVDGSSLWFLTFPVNPFPRRNVLSFAIWRFLQQEKIPFVFVRLLFPREINLVCIILHLLRPIRPLDGASLVQSVLIWPIASGRRWRL